VAITIVRTAPKAKRKPKGKKARRGSATRAVGVKSAKRSYTRVVG
jgi:hypothetical protein